jgi:S1-C subfamily serine protease
MSSRIISLFACVVSMFIGLTTQAISSEIAVDAKSVNPILISQRQQELSLNELRAKSRSITVKVLAGDAWGSGILIQKKGQTYAVITNDHVISLAKSYRIQTPDGRIYQASRNQNAQFNDDDLALLSFRSENSYQIANLATSKLTVGNKTYAAGFPLEANGFVFTVGKVDNILPKPFLRGYQLGYSNDILNGMSGGPVLNRYGEVIAINGRHKFPLWGNNYIFKDGTTPAAEVITQMERSSWAIPIQTFLQEAPQFATSRNSTPKVKTPSITTPVLLPRMLAPNFPASNTVNPQSRFRTLW